MDSAAALAQIKACMAAPSNPVPCVILRAGGTAEEIVTDQRKMGEVLGAPPTIVGGIVSLGVMVAGRKDNKGKKNKHTLPENWGQDEQAHLKGDIILFRVDDDGACAPFTLKEHQKWVDEGMPDDEPEESDDDESEEESEEEEEEEEEEDLEVFAERLKELPVAELRKACKILELNDKGGKNLLIARLHAHAQEHAGEEEESEGEKSPPKTERSKGKSSKASAKGKASPLTVGPAKKIAKTPKTMVKAGRAPSGKRRK